MHHRPQRSGLSPSWTRTRQGEEAPAAGGARASGAAVSPGHSGRRVCHPQSCGVPGRASRLCSVIARYLRHRSYRRMSGRRIVPTLHAVACARQLSKKDGCFPRLHRARTAVETIADKRTSPPIRIYRPATNARPAIPTTIPGKCLSMAMVFHTRSPGSSLFSLA